MAMGEKYVPPADAEFADDDPMLPESLVARRAAESGAARPYEPPPDAQEEGQEPAPAPAQEPILGRGKAAAVTGLQGLTGGFSEDLAAVATDLLARLKGADPASSRERARTRAKADIAAAHAQYPTQSLITQAAGELGKDVALGATSIPAMMVSGAVSGYGNSEAPTVRGRLADAESGGLSSGVFGVGGKALGAGLSKVLPDAGAKIRSLLAPAREGMHTEASQAFNTALREAKAVAQDKAAQAARAEQQAGQAVLEAQAEAARKAHAQAAKVAEGEEFALRKRLEAKLTAEGVDPTREMLDDMVAEAATKKRGLGTMREPPAPLEQGPLREFPASPPPRDAVPRLMSEARSPARIPDVDPTTEDLLAYLAKQRKDRGGVGTQAVDVARTVADVLPWGLGGRMARFGTRMADRASKNPDPIAAYARLQKQAVRNQSLARKPDQLAFAINALLKARGEEP